MQEAVPYGLPSHAAVHGLHALLHHDRRDPTGTRSDIVLLKTHLAFTAKDAEIKAKDLDIAALAPRNVIMIFSYAHKR